MSDDAPDELLGRDLDVWHVELTSRHAGANESPETFVAQAWPAVEEDLAELRDGAACAIDAVATSVGQTDVGSLALQVYLYGAPIWAAWVGILILRLRLHSDATLAGDGGPAGTSRQADAE